MSLDMEPPDDLEAEAEREAWERGARAGIRWLQSVVGSIDVGGSGGRDIPALDTDPEEEGTCPDCSGELIAGLGEQQECRRCGFRP